MFNLLIAIAATAAQPAAAPATQPVAATAGRTLKDLPSNTIAYYDIAGKEGDEIEKSLAKTLSDPANKDRVRLYTWKPEAQIIKRSEGAACTINSVTATLKSTVQLPRLANQSTVSKDVLATWNPYVAGLEEDAAASLWFVQDRLPALQNSLVGLSCDKASAAWSAGLARIRTDLAGFDAQLAAKRAAKSKLEQRKKAPARERM